jgi:TolA-binding protein
VAPAPAASSKTTQAEPAKAPVPAPLPAPKTPEPVAAEPAKPEPSEVDLPDLLKMALPKPPQKDSAKPREAKAPPPPPRRDEPWRRIAKQKNATAQLQVGLDALKLLDQREAEDSLLAVEGYFPEAATQIRTALFNLGLVYLRKRDIGRAEKTFKRLLKDFEDDAWAKLASKVGGAAVLAARDKHAQARGILQSLMPKISKHKELRCVALAAIAHSYHVQGDRRQARHYHDLARKACGQVPPLFGPPPGGPPGGGPPGHGPRPGDRRPERRRPR